MATNEKPEIKLEEQEHHLRRGLHPKGRPSREPRG